ncbi:MAG: hypothetical protein RIS35_2293 [Pseudomonadota bacterium]|jgi:2-hydroxychromene-2-carboxylate isomerase
MTRPTFAFWYDFASTYSYLAAFAVEDTAARADVTVEWRPFLLGPIFAAQGWRDSPFNLYPAKGAYMWRDMERLCARHGLTWKRPSVFPRHSVAAARVALALEPAARAGFTRAVYAANFAQDRDISDAQVLGELLESIGQPAGEVLARSVSVEVKDALRGQTAQAQAMAIFGAPTFTVGDEVFWGQDRLGDALAFARDAAAG